MVISFMSLFPQDIFSETLVTDISGLEVDYTGGSWSAVGSTFSGSATGTAQGSCSDAASETSTLTLKNVSGGRALLSFDHTKPVVGSEGYVMIDGAEVTEAGNFTKELANDESISIEMLSGSPGANTSSIQLSNVSMTLIRDVTVTFASPLGSGTYSVNGMPVDEEKIITQLSTLPFELEAKAAEGYKLEGWYSTSGNRFISSDELLTAFFDVDQTVYPVFITDSCPVWDVGGQWYTELGDAISYASSYEGSKIVLISDGTLAAGTYTIPDGTTLLIPYEVTGALNTTVPDAFRSTPAIEPSVYRTLTMEPYTKIVVNGSLCVNAKVNSNNNHYTGATSGKYGCIDMGEGCSIELVSGSELYCWGYIYGNGSITAFPGSAVYEPFEIGDVRGGTATMTMNNNLQRVLPFQQYYIQNIEVPLTIMCGATEYAVGTVTVQNDTETPTVAFIGPEETSLFQLVSGSFTKTYDPETDRVYYDINGDSNINSVSLDVGLSVDTLKYVLPLMQNTVFNIVSGTTAVRQSVYMIPGCEMKVSQGASLIIAAETDFYVYDRDEYVGNGFVFSNTDLKSSFYQPDRSDVNVFTVDKMVDAKLDVSGKLTVEGNLYTTASGANVTSSSVNGKISFANAPLSSSTVYQVTQGGEGGTEVYYHEIPVTAPQLCNGVIGVTVDPKYTPTEGTAAGGYFSYCIVEDKWHEGDPCEANYELIYWTWADDYSSASATFIEATSGYEVTINAAVTTKITEPTCETEGQTVYTAAVTLRGKTYTDAKTVTADALGHDWAAVTYSWASDNSYVKALKACGRDHSHDVEETVSTTSEVTIAPGCETEGARTYTAVFTKTEFTTQTKTVTIPAAGHIWQEITYTWASDNSSCTALKACSRDHSHDISEDATVSSSVTLEPTITEPGIMTFTAVFTDPEFETQIRNVEIPVKEVASIMISDMPKTEYAVGEDLDVTGGTILVTYADGDTGLIDMTREMVYGFDTSEEGERSLVVRYGGAETTYIINVIKVDISVIPFGSEAFREGDNYFIDGNTVTVIYELPCKIGYFDEELGCYVAIPASVNLDGSYSFTAPRRVTEVVLVVKGDADGDGNFSNYDVTLAKAAGMGRLQSYSPLQKFATDMNSDGDFTNYDVTLMKAVVMGRIEGSWI